MKKFFKGQYFVVEYIEYFLQKNKMSLPKFAERSGVDKKKIKMIMKNPWKTDITDIIKIFYYIDVPMAKAFIDLEKVD